MKQFILSVITVLSLVLLCIPSKVDASELNSNSSTNDILLELSNQDGKYIEYFEDGLRLEREVTTKENNGLFGISTHASTASSLTQEVNSKLFDKNNKKVWHSRSVGKFSYNGSQVWCTYGKTYFYTDLGSTRTLTKNTYSSAKTSSNSYYTVNSTIKTKSYGTFYLKEYVGCTRTGSPLTSSQYSK